MTTTFVDQTTLISAAWLNAVSAATEAAAITALASVTPATDQIPYFTGASSASLTGLSAFARTLLDDADAATMRATLGVSGGGSDSELDALAALTSAADTLPYFTGPGEAGLAAFTSFARTLLACVDAAAGLTALAAAPLASPVFTGTVQLPITEMNNSALKEVKTITFNGVVAIGNFGASKTIDFGAGQYQAGTMTAACTFTFTAPPGPCTLHLEMTQDGTGGWAMTLPASVKWDESYAAADKLLKTTAGARNKLVLAYNGTDYVANLLKNIA